MSTLNVNTVQSSTSNPPIFKNSGGDVAGTLCRAWVNFDGVGTVAINDSFNVSSITDNGVGDFTVNFTNALSNANYAVAGSVESGNATPVGVVTYGTNGGSRSTSGVRIITAYLDTTIIPVDEYQTSVIIFSN